MSVAHVYSSTWIKCTLHWKHTINLDDLRQVRSSLPKLHRRSLDPWTLCHDVYLLRRSPARSYVTARRIACSKTRQNEPVRIWNRHIGVVTACRLFSVDSSLRRAVLSRYAAVLPSVLSFPLCLSVSFCVCLVEARNHSHCVTSPESVTTSRLTSHKRSLCHLRFRGQQLHQKMNTANVIWFWCISLHVCIVSRINRRGPIIQQCLQRHW